MISLREDPTLEAALNLGFIEIARVQTRRFNGLKPPSVGIGDGLLSGLNGNEIHQIRPPSIGPFLGALGPNAPERFPAG